MSKTVEFFFDLGSPTTYLAYTQLPKICAQTGSQLIYQPMLLGGVFKVTGNASPISIPAKGRYMLQDLARYARRYEVPLAFNPHFPINTLLLMRAVTGMQLRHPQRFVAFIDCLFRALWVEKRNLNDQATVAAVLSEGGFDPLEVLALTNDEEVKSALKDKTEQALQRGVFGAPSMFVDNQLFFGQDRLDFVLEALS
ncbi:2-hydroxychromene-2-carboxylate isomerase family protein [Pseudomonas chlororaphis subsp. aurantiaca]|uniref:2-hydroxychromene-2-carboxylate isomerase n=1 Tax=Pseudomonas chlororaphis TaxID=587753 RepID=UPI000F54FC7B|nr:2-hydroxychromene-2-carboxylate isomerase [Pseudomonas chlororaphis]AZD37160.1 2-hydroxychromene-2-carboxylate isomerase family protein [Pseudomonas chlororaphis subsp. aurantiaca]AZD43499.1 2-hydroxychromene-2-carboxylate isomerase family protein [Pseudomonas chlororaphis subsp. aurantiaca]AZD49739.1 2-hydroxychromene-2-carboxylate isomerase family protein [Pseudomonas chlororaphis subsp. aurantiaca]AZD74636.1 2-hydroxychromene-2-carboxylate isomerase family protein [Pseudomonas chlororaphi